MKKKYSLIEAIQLIESTSGWQILGIEYEDGSFRKFNVRFAHVGKKFVDIDFLNDNLKKIKEQIFMQKLHLGS